MTSQVLIEIRDNVEDIKEIAKRAQARLAEERAIRIDKAEGIPTITYWMLKKAIEYINDTKVIGEDIEINIQDLIKLGVTYRETEDGEKDANFTPFADIINSENL